MKTLREVAAQHLRWTDASHAPREYQLRGGEALLATLRWMKLEGSLATAEAGPRRWTFKRSGFLNPKVRIRAEGSATDVAVLSVTSVGEGVLQGPEGRTYLWSTTNFWRSEWGFSGQGGGIVYRLKPSFASRRLAAEVEIEPAAVSLPDLELVVLLGWYLLVLMSDEAGGGPAASASLFE
jgi:hypothetical protein